MRTEIGVLYSTTTGTILRIIDPDDDRHLDWLENHKPEGTSLYRPKREDIMPGKMTAPNMEKIIDFANINKGPKLKEGEIFAIIHKGTNEVVGKTICCPDLFNKRLAKNKAKDPKNDCFLVKTKSSFIGQKYDPIAKKFKVKNKSRTLVFEDEWYPGMIDND